MALVYEEAVMKDLRARIVIVSVIVVVLPLLFASGSLAGGQTQTDFAPLGELARDVAGIGVIVGLLFFLIRKVLPPAANQWYFEDHPWLVNLSVVIVSVGLAILGAWLNALSFEPRNVAEYIWLGLFSAAVATLGYEFSDNLGRDVRG